MLRCVYDEWHEPGWKMILREIGRKKIWSPATDRSPDDRHNISMSPRERIWSLMTWRLNVLPLKP
jgi:hypothetical protein